MRVTVSELEQWVECPLKWYYSHVRRLRAKPDPEAFNPGASGTAIHKGVEAGLLRAPGTQPRRVAMDAIQTYLEVSGGGRYLRGAEAAISGVPDELWNREAPQAEDQLEVEYPLGEEKLLVVGRPDLWYRDGDSLVIVDFKSTAKDEHDRLLTYQTWNMQVRYYAVMLHDTLARGMPVYTRHVVLSTRGKHAVGAPYLVSPGMLNETRDRMLELALAISNRPTDEGLVRIAHYSRACPIICDYAPIDEIRLTGGNVESIIEEQYERRDVAKAIQ
jgi:hypothetical protein